MPKKAGMRWTVDTLSPTIRRFSLTANFAISAAAKELAEEIQAWMRENAPWEDRTGAARQGLGAEVDSRGFRQDIYLYHSVEYGVWLEIRWGGLYAILTPAMEHFAGEAAWVRFEGVMAAASLRGA